MEEVYHNYKHKKFSKCLEILRSIPESDDLVENLATENCILVCESYVGVTENDPAKLDEIQEKHYLFFQKVLLMDDDLDPVPLQLKLTVTFNFIFWLSFDNDTEFDDSDTDEYLELLHKGLSSVLGRKVPSENTSNLPEKVLNAVIGLKELILNVDHKTALLIVELVVVVMLFTIRLKSSLLSRCSDVVALFIKESNFIGASSQAVDNFLQVRPQLLNLCKFNLCGPPTTLSEVNLNAVDCLYVFQSVLLYLLEDFRGSLKTLQKNVKSSVKSLWHYLVILNAYELENWSLCSGFLTKMSALIVEKNLKARLHLMHGKLCSVERNYKEAVQQLKNALVLSPNCPVIHCCLGQVYGKMGLYDLMLESFEKHVEILQLISDDSIAERDHLLHHKKTKVQNLQHLEHTYLQMSNNEEVEEDLKIDFETTLLGWIHPVDEITEVESYYALAISYGLNENYKKACEAFERVLQSWSEDQSERKRRTIEMPKFLTILHEAAVLNLMQGNLVRAEQIALDAIEQYEPLEPQQNQPAGKLSLHKDAEWLERVIHQELLETDMEPKELSSETVYTEDLVFIFPQNIIGLLILSEVYRIQGVEEYKKTLSSVFQIFSKYLANKEKEGEGELLTLVKALAGKTCVKIATIQMENPDQYDVEKMLKRALSCDKGDKDALCKYYKFLQESGRQREASKLWRSFSKKEKSISIDSLHSFFLRYFLGDKVTKREVDKIQQEVEPAEVRLL